MQNALRTLWTVGHSTRSLDELTALLETAGVTTVVDVRRSAGSRRNPQFSGESLARQLPVEGIDYIAMPDLGGRRELHDEAAPSTWRNAALRGYAQYMATPAYARARARLVALAAVQRVAVMCAEGAWRQCHRSLIADDFKAGGWTVLHIAAPGQVEEHPYTDAARIEDGRLTYAAPADAQGSLF
jgi:uncharacterized protein (DUF488 family)